LCWKRYREEIIKFWDVCDNPDLLETYQETARDELVLRGQQWQWLTKKPKGKLKKEGRDTVRLFRTNNLEGAMWCAA
jgi:hypothetical protein